MLACLKNSGDFGKPGISGEHSPHFLPEFGGCLPRFFLENRGEIRLFIVAQIEADFGNRLVGGGEQVFCFEEFAGLDKFGDAFLQDLIADQIEIAGRHEQFFGIKLHAFRAAEIFLQDGQKVFERGILAGEGRCLSRLDFPPFRFDHRKKGAQQVPDDREICRRLLHFIENHFTDLH